MKGLIDIIQIAKIQPEYREKEQIGLLAAFLVHKVDFFKNDSFTDPEYMKSIAERMSCHTFQKGQILMRKGDEGDRMYISFQGSLGIYLKNDFSEDPVAIVQPYRAVGERALEKQGDLRTATIVAMEDCICLALEKKDFQDLVAR